ncbi:MAG TPA: GNAT family N-acetyltransferase [Candidatus Limnocylindrales bacterium]|nr:GNAT family N-acetyltransferase [Candidatus Limnocylindrales bacterium]
MAGSALRVVSYPDVAAYLDAVGPFLIAREAEHNLLLGIAGTVRDYPDVYPGPKLFLAAMDGDEVITVASRTDPWRILLSETAHPEAVELFVPAAAGHGTPLPGVAGPPAPAARFARAFGAATGRAASRTMAERVFRLERVIPPPLPPGRWRSAELADVDRIAAWLVAFQAEAVPHDPPMRDVHEVVTAWVGGRRFVYLWEVDGKPVSLATASAPTPNGIRIGPVYTPPEQRGRGYARALTAAASQDQLDRGRRFCFLFTDLANPVSNRIYQQIGYEAVTDVDVWQFDAARGDRATLGG